MTIYCDTTGLLSEDVDNLRAKVYYYNKEAVELFCGGYLECRKYCRDFWEHEGKELIVKLLND